MYIKTPEMDIPAIEFPDTPYKWFKQEYSADYESIIKQFSITEDVLKNAEAAWIPHYKYMYDRKSYVFSALWNFLVIHDKDKIREIEKAYKADVKSFETSPIYIISCEYDGHRTSAQTVCGNCGKTTLIKSDLHLGKSIVRRCHYVCNCK